MDFLFLWSHPKEVMTEPPFVSVIIPARNEEAFLAECLDSVLTQSYSPERVEIFVIENGSSDRTRDIALGYANRNNRIHVVISNASHQAGAMNEGIEKARGTIMLRVDAHGHLAPNYVSEVVAAFTRHPHAVAVGGPYVPTKEGLIERVTGLARSSRFGVGGGWGSDTTGEDHAVRTVGCPAYRRDALIAAGLFDVAMVSAEDDELNWRLIKNGGTIMQCPSLCQHNRPRTTLRALARQYWNYGQGRLRVLLKHWDFLQPKHLVPTLFVATVAILGGTAIFSSQVRILLGALIGAYAIVLAAAGIGAARSGWREAALVPLAVAIIHVAYGTGMLWGFIRHLVGRFQTDGGVQETQRWRYTIGQPPGR